MPLEFVNYQGTRLPDQVALKKRGVPRKTTKPEEKSFHKGWRVTGIPPGALDEAMSDHKRVSDMATKAGGKEIKPFDSALWIQNHRGKPVRSKPYELECAAKECAELAEKCGWTRIQVLEVKKVVNADPSLLKGKP